MHIIIVLFSRQVLFLISHLYVSNSHLSLHIIADHKVSKNATGGDFGLLNDAGAKGDLTHILFVFDDSGDRGLWFGWGREMGSV